jgi:AcrR family transcriptional regulator
VTLKVVTTAARRSKRAGRPESSAPTREVILDTAERLFAARGVDGLALRDLAQEMGLTAPSLYNHFSSKQALYEAVLERGLRPIFNLIVEAWHPGAVRPDQVRSTAERLTAHLSTHPHLARLLQRALLDQPGRFHVQISHWLSPIYRHGLAVIRESADTAGWEPAEVPYLAIGLFGLMFSYFINVSALESFDAWGDDAFSARSLKVQRQFLEKALARLLSLRPHAARRNRVI